MIYCRIQSDDRRDDRLDIDGETYHHLARVRRVRVGMSLRATQPDGRTWQAEITEITADHISARILGEIPPQGISPCRITLYQAVLKGEKMDLVIQKATELGAWRLAPLFTRRTIPRWDAAHANDRVERWQRIAESAAEQCERSVPLLIEPPLALTNVLQQDIGTTFLLHERNGRSLRAFAAENSALDALSLFLGPEGGWDEGEAAALLAAGAIPIHLGGRILRAETAAIATLTLAQYLWGDLG